MVRCVTKKKRKKNLVRRGLTGKCIEISFERILPTQNAVLAAILNFKQGNIIIQGWFGLAIAPQALSYDSNLDNAVKNTTLKEF